MKVEKVMVGEGDKAQRVCDSEGVMVVQRVRRR